MQHWLTARFCPLSGYLRDLDACNDCGSVFVKGLDAFHMIWCVHGDDCLQNIRNTEI